jgi:hypothetical protein
MILSRVRRYTLLTIHCGDIDRKRVIFSCFSTHSVQGARFVNRHGRMHIFVRLIHTLLSNYSRYHGRQCFLRRAEKMHEMPSRSSQTPFETQCDGRNNPTVGSQTVVSTGRTTRAQEYRPGLVGPLLVGFQVSLGIA